MTYAQPITPKNGLALTALVLGIIGIILAPVLIGGLIGIVALILGLVALKNPNRRGLAITGIITGALSLPMMLVGVLMVAMLLPALATARMRAREVMAASNLKGLTIATFMYAQENGGDLPPHIANMGPMLANNPQTLLDRRRSTTPLSLPPGTDWSTHGADVDAHCDFYYAGAGLKLAQIANTSEVVILYDHPGTGRARRVLAFSDGHVATVPSGSVELDQIVDATNKVRAAAKLPPLPAQLGGPPAAGPE